LLDQIPEAGLNFQKESPAAVPADESEQIVSNRQSLRADELTLNDMMLNPVSQLSLSIRENTEQLTEKIKREILSTCFNMPASSRLLDGHELTSPYKSLHDNYVSNRRDSKCPVSALLAAGCLLVLGILLAVAVIEMLKNEDRIHEALNPPQTQTCCNQTGPIEQS
ncbi:hypothetical protein cypCar_00048411, partial [Cyprinus carpio]